jgi:NDP-sugar pyrophosphorylase family protein
MKAMILAAGQSTRLGELGAQLPKPMLPLCGRPLLEWTLERLGDCGFTEIVINLHHASAVIPSYFRDGSAHGLAITYVHEPELLGTAGGVRNAREHLGDDTFLVVYGDTVLDWDPRPMVREHVTHRPLATIAVAEVEDASQLGVVRFSSAGRIEAFMEKPGRRPELGRWVNAGVYALEPTIFEWLPEAGFGDFGAHVFPVVLERGLPLRAYKRPSKLLVVDTPEQYWSAQRIWAGPESHPDAQPWPALSQSGGRSIAC